MTDKGTGAENLIWLKNRQGGRFDPWAVPADDILARLTGRIAELEARVSAVLADLDAAPPRADLESGSALNAHRAEPSRGVDKMGRASRVEADDELTRASEERRALANEMRLLREAIQEARSGQPSPGLGAGPVEAHVPPDLRAAVADEMRVLLAELFTDFRARAAPPASIAPPAAIGAIASSPASPEPTVEDVETPRAPADQAATAAPPIASPIAPPASIIEHVDELIRPLAGRPIEADHVEEIRAPEQIASTDMIDLSAAPFDPVAPVLDEVVEQVPVADAVAPSEPVELEAAPADDAPRTADWPVFEAPASTESIDLRLAAPQPIVDEPVAELQTHDAPPPFEVVESAPAPTESVDSVVPGYIEDLDPLRRVEPIAPMYEPSVEPSFDAPVAPPAMPPVPDPRIDALWDAASSPTEQVESAPPPSTPEPPSFVEQAFVDETRSPEIIEAPFEPTPELAPESSIQFVPEAPAEFTPEPPAIFEPEPPVRAEPLNLMESTASFSSLFPELKVPDERGLHQIQIVISPIHSFSRLLDTEARIRALSTVNALHLRDFRNGVATFAVTVGEAISPAEFGAVIQMLQELHLRLEGTTQTTVELRAEDEPPAS